MNVINEEDEQPTMEEVLQDNRDEAEELAESDDFKEEESSDDD